MKRQCKTPLAMLAVAALCTFGATGQASAMNLLDRMLGNSEAAASCGCSQKSGAHVQRCGSKCDSSHVQHSSKGKAFSGHEQHAGKSKGGHVQRTSGKKGGGGKASSTLVDLKAMMQDKFADVRCKLSYAIASFGTRMRDQMDNMQGRLVSFRPKFSFASSKGKGKGKSSGDTEGDTAGDPEMADVSAPSISIPGAWEPDPTT